jgi:multidrug resistance protein, MATE family
MEKTRLHIREVKRSLNLAIPLLFSEWLYALNFFVITWIAAQLGREALAAIAIAQSIYFFLMMMISGISAATAILAAQNLGAKNVNSIKQVFAQSVLLNMLLAFVAGVILWIVPYFLPIFGIDDRQVVALIKIALHAFLWSILPFTFLIMIEKFLIGLHKSSLVLFFTTLTIPIYMFANYALVLGKFGLPKLGLAGFGYGQAIAYGSLCIMFVIMTFLMPSLRAYKLFSAFKNLASGAKYFFEIWRIGWPLGIMFSIEVGAFLVFTFLMSLFGVDALAAFQIIRQYLVLSFTTLFALTESTAVRISHAVGENDRLLVKECFYVNISITLIFMLIFAGIYLVAKKSLLSLDIDMLLPGNYQIIYYAKYFLTAIAIFVVFDGMRNVTAGALRGLKDTKSNMFSSVIGYWLIGLPLAYIFGKVCNFGPAGLWLGFISGIAVSAIYLWVRFQALTALT